MGWLPGGRISQLQDVIASLSEQKTLQDANIAKLVILLHLNVYFLLFPRLRHFRTQIIHTQHSNKNIWVQVGQSQDLVVIHTNAYTPRVRGNNMKNQRNTENKLLNTLCRYNVFWKIMNKIFINIHKCDIYPAKVNKTRNQKLFSYYFVFFCRKEI